MNDLNTILKNAGLKLCESYEAECQRVINLPYFKSLLLSEKDVDIYETRQEMYITISVPRENWGIWDIYPHDLTKASIQMSLALARKMSFNRLTLSSHDGKVSFVFSGR